MGGFLVNEKCRTVFGPGTHASSFGGNPVCAAAACAVLDVLDDGVLREVTRKGGLSPGQDGRAGAALFGKDQGLGLMTGVEVADGYTNKELCARLNQGGLLSLTAGPGSAFSAPVNHYR